MVELVLRITLSLLAVVTLMWLLARLARRPLSRRSGSALDILARQQLTRGSAVAIVRAVDRTLVVGITEQQVNLLVEVDAEAMERHAEAEDAARVARAGGAAAARQPDADHGEDSALTGSALSRRTWTQAMAALRERTVRK